MRRLFAVFWIAAVLGWAVEEERGLQLQLTPRQVLKLDLSSGDYRIEPGFPDRIVILSQKQPQEQNAKPHFGLDTTPSEAAIKVDGPKNYSAIIQVPSNSSLKIRLDGGRLRVNGINGDKDIESNAATVLIDMGRADDYSQVDASVDLGHIEAQPFRVAREGFGRSFAHRGPGRFRLHAHVRRGEIRLIASGS
jgi:hypothetical protein